MTDTVYSLIKNSIKGRFFLYPYNLSDISQDEELKQDSPSRVYEVLDIYPRFSEFAHHYCMEVKFLSSGIQRQIPLHYHFNDKEATFENVEDALKLKCK